MRQVKIATAVMAVHLILLGFFFFKPPIKYFTVICLSTVIVWSAVFSFSRRKRWAGIIAGSLLQLATQQAAYHAWLSDQTGMWWPLAQFLSLQYVVVLRLASTPEETPPPRHDS